jgi:hypothetical protein
MRVAEQMASKAAAARLRLCLAGRDEAKLKALAERLPGGGGIGVLGGIDVGDAASVQRLAASGRLLLNCVGPYRWGRPAGAGAALFTPARPLRRASSHSLPPAPGPPTPPPRPPTLYPLGPRLRFYGEPVFRAAAEAGTDYLDLCGEPEFIERMELACSDAARASGALMACASAFDSVRRRRVGGGEGGTACRRDCSRPALDSTTRATSRPTLRPAHRRSTRPFRRPLPGAQRPGHGAGVPGVQGARGAVVGRVGHPGVGAKGAAHPLRHLVRAGPGRRRAVDRSSRRPCVRQCCCSPKQGLGRSLTACPAPPRPQGGGRPRHRVCAQPCARAQGGQGRGAREATQAGGAAPQGGSGARVGQGAGRLHAAVPGWVLEGRGARAGGGFPVPAAAAAFVAEGARAC